MPRRFYTRIIARISVIILTIGLVQPGLAQRRDGDFIPPPIDPTKGIPENPTKGIPEHPYGAHKARPHRKQASQIIKPSPHRKKTRIAPRPASRVAPGWSKADYRCAINTITKTLVGGSWLSRFKGTKNRRPTIRLTKIRNRTHYKLNRRYLRRRLKKILSASKKARLVRSKKTRADYILSGWLLAMNDSAGRKMTLQSSMLCMQLIHIKSGEKVWMDLYRLRKLVRRRLGKKRSRSVSILAADDAVDLSGAFNDTDASRIVRTAARSLLASSWHRNKGKALRFYALERDKSSARLEHRYISLWLQREVIRSGKIMVLASLSESKQFPQKKKQRSATHLFGGSIRLRKKKRQGTVLLRYTVSFAVTDKEGKRVWTFSKPVTKRIQRSKRVHKTKRGL